jgi:replicative DNA helicase
MSDMTQAPPTRQGPERGGSSRRGSRELSRVFEQLPPHAIEAEMSLLGSMLIDPKVVGDVLLVVRSADDFFKPGNGAIFDVMVKLYDQHATLDLVQLNQKLVDDGALDAIGGLEYLVELANAVPSASNVMHYARLVREKAAIRQLIEAAGDILYDAYHSPDDAQGILEEAEQRIFKIAQQAEQTQVESLSALLQEAMTIIEANQGRQITGLPTGYRDLDSVTGGLQRGEMIILAARPSMGKTALALNVAEQMAMQGVGVGVFSLEMSKQQLVQRVLSARSGIDSHRFRRNMLSRDDFRRLMVACDELQDSPMFIDDTPGLTLLQMRAKARRMVAKHDVKALFIDYLQLLSTRGRSESRQVEVSEISRGIKAMARELDLPVVCLSQLNRAAEQREGHRPRLSDLRESGSIEQDADVVAMLHREEYFHQADPEWIEENEEKRGLAELIIAKQRNGPTGTVKLAWSADTMRFRDYSPSTPPPGFEAPRERAGGLSSTQANAIMRGRKDLGDDADDDLPPF